MLQPLRRRPAAGFTLLELMIVVVIVGILAATALPSFQGYVNRSRANDGRMQVEVIKLRQEAYRSEFGPYVSAPLWPTTTQGLDFVPWLGGNAQWNGLGFAPPGGQTRFTFQSTAGIPMAGAPRGLSGTDFWYFVAANANFDRDAIPLVFEGYSEADFIYCSSTTGWE